MIKLIKHDQVDEVKWNKCIRSAFNGLIYAYTWYLDIVHGEWDALVENDYERVMPLTRRKKWGFNYLLQPYFVQQLGVFSKSLLTPAKTMEFLANVPGEYRVWDIRLNSFNKLAEDSNYEVIQHANHLLDLINTHEKINRKYSGQTKRNLRNSSKHTLTLLKNIKPETIIDLFRSYRGKKLGKWRERHYAVLKNLMYASIYKGSGVAYGVFNEFNELDAGAFFLKSKNRLIFLFSGTSEIARKNSAMTFLIDAVIREYAGRQVVLDFEGSDDPQLARFYKGFGAKRITYPGLFLNRLPFPADAAFKLYRKIKQG